MRASTRRDSPEFSSKCHATVTQCLLEMTRLSLTRDQKGGGESSKDSSYNAGLVRIWSAGSRVEPADNAHRRKETERRRRGRGASSSHSLSLSFSLYLFASLSPANRRKKARATTLRSVHLHAARVCVRARTGTRLSSHFLPLVHALGTHPNHRQKSFFPTCHDRGTRISLFLVSLFFKQIERLSWFVREFKWKFQKRN